MLGKRVKVALTLSLAGFSALGLSACRNGSSSVISFKDAKGTEIKADSTLEAKVAMQYTINVEFGEGVTEKKVNWTVSDSTIVSYVGSDTSIKFTPKLEGSFSFTATLASDATKSASFKVNAKNGQSVTYKLGVDTLDAKTEFKKGDRFTSEGLVVNRVTVVDGEESANVLALSNDEYTLSLSEGTTLDTEGAITVTVTSPDYGEASYKITVEANPAYEAINFFNKLNDDNYLIGDLGDDGSVSPSIGYNGDYLFHYSTGKVYALVDDTIQRFDASAVNNKITYKQKEDFKVFSATDSTFSLDTVDNFEPVFKGLELKSGSEVTVPTTDEVSVETVTSNGASYEQYNVDNAQSATDILIASGYGFVADSYQVLSGSIIFEGEGDDQMVLFIANVSDGSKTLTLPVVFLEMGTYSEPTFDEFLTTKYTKDATNDAALEAIAAPIRSENFVGKFGQMSTGKYAGTYTTYSINKNAFEFYQNYVLDGVVSKNGFLGMYKIPEGKEGAGTIKQYTHDGTTPTYVNQSDSNLSMYWQLYRSSNWLGFAGVDSVYKVDFLPLWNLSSISSVNSTSSKYTAISYALYNQTLAKEFALTAFNYDDFGNYTLEGMTATLYDDKNDGNYDYVYIDLMISGDGVNSSAAIYDRMLIDLKTVGKTTITVADSEIAKIKDASTAA